jgi:DNA-binding NarL/FixJ family response regulator
MGFTVNEIAKHLFLSPHTIITYRRNLLQKLEAKNGAELVRNAIIHDLLDLRSIAHAG